MKPGRQITSQKIIEEKIYNIHGNNISMSNYIKTHEYADFHCNICDYNWKTTPISVIRGTGCAKCAFKKLQGFNKTNFDDVKNFIESKNCKLISKEYINNKEKLEIQFECRHICLMSFECFKRGERCSICSQKVKNLSKRVPIEQILKFIDENNFVFIGFPNDYVNRKSLIEFKCKFNHYNKYAIREFLKNHNCKECTKIKQSLDQTGSKGSNWQGGITELKSFLNKYIKDWKKESAKNCNYKCIISGERFDDIHHLQSFNLLLKETIQELNLELKDTVGEYLEEELFLLINKIKEVHNRYPLGVCLTKSWHKKFHKEYGAGNNTPQQWYEFLNRVNSGEITI